LDDLAAGENPTTKEVARGKRAALGADSLEQARAKLRTAGEEYQSQVQPFEEGRGYVGFLYDAAYHVLESELALAPGEAERIAARQHYWERLARAATIVKMRHELGRVPIQAYAESLRQLRGAELMLRQAPDGPAKK
jgi:hypothetical protein